MLAAIRTGFCYISKKVCYTVNCYDENMNVSFWTYIISQIHAVLFELGKEYWRYSVDQGECSQPTITCSSLAMGTLEPGVEYIQS